MIKDDLDYETAQFLNKQADKLIEVLDSPDVSFQEKEEIALKLGALLGKINFELVDAMKG
jgi:hypothetical protein